MRKLIFILGLLILLPMGRAGAQLAAPNDMGVSMGHVHLNVHDVDAAKQWFVTLGGTPVKFGPGEAVKFPGVLILLRKADPTGGSVGTVVDHFGFQVPDEQKALAKWDAAGFKIERNATNPKQAYLYTPDNAKVEVLQDDTLTIPIKFHHIHFYVHEVKPGIDGTEPDMQIQAWYAKMFGAKPGKRAQWQAADLPGVNLTFAKVDMSTVPTVGRAVDHIGFEVQGLEAFCKKLEANGVKFDMPYTKRPELGIALAFLTDPWGTRIELTEGLNKL